MIETSAGNVTQQAREEELLHRVVASFDDCTDPRLRELMYGIVTHLHTFIREMRLTEAELTAGLHFLTAVGRASDDQRHEFILLADVLGASMQTIGVNNEAVGTATEATVFGPFFVERSPRIDYGGDIALGAPGEPCWIEGVVTDTEGAPVAHARIEAWEADDDGRYDVQYADGRVSARGHLFSDADGRYGFWALTPTPYPIPSDGPVGRLLAATGRSPMRAAHLHLMVSAAGLRTLVTHMFVRGGALLDADTVFGVKESLIVEFEQMPAGLGPAGRQIDHPWSRARFDIILAPAAG